jgi:hypothetical protein
MPALLMQPPEGDKPDTLFLDSHAAARLLGVSERTLRGWRCERQGPPYRALGRTIRYRRDELLAWADAQQPAPERAPTAA